MTNEKDYPLSMMKNPFMEHNGIEICDVSPEGSRLRAVITETSLNPYGMIHGGLLFTMLDIVAGVTARADNHNYVTQSVYVNYLGNLKDVSEIFAESEVIKRGNAITVIHSMVKSAEGKLLADATVDMFRLHDC